MNAATLHSAHSSGGGLDDRPTCRVLFFHGRDSSLGREGLLPAVRAVAVHDSGARDDDQAWQSNGPEVSRIGLGCMGMSGMYGPADAAREHRDDPRGAGCGHHSARHRRLLRDGPQRAADLGGAANARPRRGADQRQVRRASADPTRAGWATTLGRPRSRRRSPTACSGWERPRRHLPARAAGPSRCRSRRRSGRSPRWCRPATSATSACRRSARTRSAAPPRCIRSATCRSSTR